MEIFSSSHAFEKENENANLQEQDFSLSHTPYEGLSSNKIKNEIQEPPPNAQ